ncbi:MAG: HAD family phosphatase [Oscillospiraceae bacterium]|nr:HAD family phosphatase [Oscillospiraceae bacterium]
MISTECKAVIFDMDGVLVDTEPHYYAADELLLSGYGIAINAEIVTALTGASYKEFPNLIRKLNPGITLSDEELMKQYKDSLFNACRRAENMIDGVMNWIERFRGMGYKIAVGSASNARVVYDIVERFAINPDATVTADDAERGKPHPDIFLECAKRLGVPARECLVIEDSENGVKAAKNAGMKCAAFTGTKRHDFDLSSAQLEIDAFNDANWEKVLELL